MSTDGSFEQLTLRLAEITDLQKTGALLFWDQRTKMPPAGGRGPAERRRASGREPKGKFRTPAAGGGGDHRPAEGGGLAPVGPARQDAAGRRRDAGRAAGDDRAAPRTTRDRARPRRSSA